MSATPPKQQFSVCIAGLRVTIADDYLVEITQECDVSALDEGGIETLKSVLDAASKAISTGSWY